MRLTVTISALLLFVSLNAGLRAQPAPGNRPERMEWFRDLGLGLFIHWSLDSQVGSVISHSMVGASEDYLKRFAEELPRSFNPKKFDPAEWARLARLAGFRYVVFTTKHHSGFSMFDTEATEFNIMNTPYGRDITRQICDAFRREGLAIGFYYSPDDFHFLWKQGTPISRRRPEVYPANNPALMKHDLTQIRELMTNYGPIDIMFLDGPPEGLRELTWELQPDTIVTRGALETPEQYTPGVPLEGAWEGNLTMGGQWQYRPTNETYKSGGRLIKTWIETRAKGGNLLLNIGPKPDGEIPIEQEARLREIALWNMVNQEAMGAVRPWVITNEGDIWFTKAVASDTLYAFLTGEAWPWGEWRTVTLKSVKATGKTEISVLGHGGKIVEYRPRTDPAPKWKQTGEGLEITAMRAQRLYNDRRWPNPVVLKITHVEPGLAPPIVVTSEVSRRGREATLRAKLESLGDQSSVEVGFEYRRKKDTARMYEPDFPWQSLGLDTRRAPGDFEGKATKLDPALEYEYRAVVKHPAITLYGLTKTIEAAQ